MAFLSVSLTAMARRGVCFIQGLRRATTRPAAAAHAVGQIGTRAQASSRQSSHRVGLVQHSIGSVRGILVLAFMAVGKLPAQSMPVLRIEKIASYGWSDLSDSTGPLSVNDRRLGAGMLGAAGGAVEGRNGSVYVVDPLNNKVVIFDKNGSFRHAFGRDGEGPGEFRNASRIVAGSDGSIYVWDFRLKRISHFTADGQNLSQLVVPLAPPGVDFVIGNDRVWFVKLLLKRGFAVRAFDLATGVVADSFAPIGDDDVAMHSTGNPGAITGTSTGAIVYAGPYPGILRIWAGGTTRTVGTNRFPAARVTTQAGGTHWAPVSVRGIAARPDGTFALVYTTAALSGDATSPHHNWLEILSRDGKGLAEAELPTMEGTPRIAATANGDLLLSVTDGYPQVWRVRVAFTAKANK